MKKRELAERIDTLEGMVGGLIARELALRQAVRELEDTLEPLCRIRQARQEGKQAMGCSRQSPEGLG